MNEARLSAYERRALVEIHEWKNPQLTWFDSAMRGLNWPLDKVGDGVFRIPGIGWVLQKSIGGIVGTANDLAQWSVRPEAIFKEYRERGCKVSMLAEIYDLDMEDVDKTIGFLAAKYKSIATLEGGVTGAAGMPGIPVDIIALVSLNLRAIGEYATYCGFDVSIQSERLFAMNVLALASSPSDASKALAMAQLVKIAQDVAKKKTWKQLEEHAFVRILQQIAKTLSTRLTKPKVGQVIPGTGAFVGAGFNAYYTSKVCDSAYHLYRERFLATKYGDGDIIEVTVPPPDTLDPVYPEVEIPILEGEVSPPEGAAPSEVTKEIATFPGHS